LADLSLEQVKTCSKCGDTKPTAEFHKQSDGMFGVRRDCKVCNRARVARYKAANPGCTKRWYDANKHRAAVWNASRREREPDFHKKWRDANREHVRAQGRAANQRSRTKISRRISDAVAANIWGAIKHGSKRGRKTFELLGYSVDELMAHLEKHFTVGMSWDNYGRGGWEIDHIIPLSAHNFETPDHHDFKRAWALTNLQPLWAPENASKNDRLSEPFQPSLAI